MNSAYEQCMSHRQRLVHEDLLLELEVIACVQGGPARKSAAKPKAKVARKLGRKANR